MGRLWPTQCWSNVGLLQTTVTTASPLGGGGGGGGGFIAGRWSDFNDEPMEIQSMGATKWNYLQAPMLLVTEHG